MIQTKKSVPGKLSKWAKTAQTQSGQGKYKQRGSINKPQHYQITLESAIAQYQRGDLTADVCLKSGYFGYSNWVIYYLPQSGKSSLDLMGENEK